MRVHAKLGRDRLNEIVCLVTGAGRGIGQGIALELGRAGASVIVADLDITPARLVANEIISLRASAAAIELDVSNDRAVDRCLKESIREFGKLDVLVNCAGIFQNNIGLEEDAGDFTRCIDVNLVGAWRMIRASVPYLKDQGGGRIVNISSVGGRRGIEGASAYCASKAGIISLTQSLALELGPHNINVNAVCPGDIPTRMQEAISNLRASRGLAGGVPAVPIGGALSVRDVGRAVVFFASDYSRNISGQALNVDGGYVLS
jgi:NAD(P)-dependent dehydrogenase (short-subunit alcohol dehydrogenase family)